VVLVEVRHRMEKSLKPELTRGIVPAVEGVTEVVWVAKVAFASGKIGLLPLPQNGSCRHTNLSSNNAGWANRGSNTTCGTCIAISALPGAMRQIAEKLHKEALLSVNDLVSHTRQ
jgi:hypothetical protein